MRKVSGFVNYDKSEFESPAALYDGDDERLERLWKSQYPLAEFSDPKNFKSYDELKARLDEVLLGDDRGVATAEDDTVNNATVSPSPVTPSTSTEEEDISKIDDTKDAMSYFNQLASED